MWEISLRDPVHFVLWWTGGVMWTAVFVFVVGLMLAATWQALRATVSVGRQLWRHHVTRGRSRAEYACSVGEAWWFAFWHEGLLR